MAGFWFLPPDLTMYYPHIAFCFFSSFFSPYLSVSLCQAPPVISSHSFRLFQTYPLYGNLFFNIKSTSSMVLVQSSFSLRCSFVGWISQQYIHTHDDGRSGWSPPHTHTHVCARTLAHILFTQKKVWDKATTLSKFKVNEKKKNHSRETPFCFDPPPNLLYPPQKMTRL